MFLPVGVDDARVSRWPVVTFTLAVLTLAVTASVIWHDHLVQTGPWFADVDAYHLAHPDLDTSGACEEHLTPVPAAARVVQGRVAGDPKRLAALCSEALDARSRSHPLWLIRPGVGIVQLGTLAGGLAFPDVPSLAIGLLLLVFVLGSFLEDAWGRDRYLAFWLLASVAVTVAYQRFAPPDATDVLAAGPAVSAALLAAFAGSMGKKRVHFLGVGMGGLQRISLPGWAVAVFWLGTRLLLRMFGQTRVEGAGAAELAGFAIGAVTAAIAHFQRWDEREAPQPDAAPAPTWATQMSAPVGSRAVPEPQAETANDPPLLFDSPAPHTPAKVPAPMPADVAPLFQQDFPLDDVPVRPVLDVPPVVPVEADSGWARFTRDEPALMPALVPAPVAPLMVSPPDPEPAPQVAPVASPFAGLADPFRFDLPSSPTPDPQPSSADPFAHWTAPAADPAPAYAPILATPAPAEAPSRMPIERWQLLGRDTVGLQFRDVHGRMARLPPEHLLAVTAGIVKGGEPGTPGPALLLDVVLDEHPRRCVRLRPSPESLAVLWPSYARADAVAALARELASGRALRLPQTPEWPGPPWATFANVGAMEAVSLMGPKRR